MKIGNTAIPKPNGKGKKIAIVLPYFNDELGLKLLKSTKTELLALGVEEKNINIYRTFGALELPFTCQKLAKSKKFDAIIALGIVIKGGTYHFELVCNHTYDGLMQAQLNTETPIVFGVLTCNTEKQAKERLTKGKDFALTALLQTNKL